MYRWGLAVALLACGSSKPLRLERVVLYQNGIGYFERAGVIGGDRLVLRFSHHEIDDVLKTLTVIDRSGAAVATVDVPAIGAKDHRIPVGVKLTGGKGHDVQVSYAVPVPTWKAAYRVVLDDKAALLQGWAVIDNASQEDWVNVSLTLATGAPMSYSLDLKTPQFVERPDVTGKMVAPAVRGPVANEKVTAANGDKDGDGITNENDLCPDAPEDKDGFEDDDGCPDPDNDKDRILDKYDKCPNEPETYNGIDDDDGCPDRGRVVVTDTAIEIFDHIYFEARSDNLKPVSFPIIDAVAATLQGNPSITLVEVQGHAAANEPDAFAIATQRAAAVRAYLIKKGVAASRLQIQSYGSTQPMDQRANDAAHAKNRRVGFLILKRASEDAPRRPDKPVAIDTTSVQNSARTTTKPVEVAGAFRYQLGEKITIKRGTSKMVSIVNKPIAAEDAYLWRPDDNAPGSDKHPFRAVRLVNSSGFTLQPGSIAIFARGTFVGDSLLDRIDLDETAWIPYALDSGTTVTSKTAFEEKPVRIVSLQKGTLVVENSGSKKTTYTISVGRQPPKQIYIRHKKARGYTIASAGGVRELPPGSLDQGEAWLVPIPILASKVSEITLDEREPRRRTFALLDARTLDLAAYLEGSPNLPAGLPDKLRQVIALRGDVAKIEDDLSAARAKFSDAVQRAHEIRESIKALDRVQNADDLRKGLVASLRTVTKLTDELTKSVETHTQALATTRTKLQELVRDLVLEEPKPAK
jgi:outer membrane protein OmpA-like peptidoglycan-associated protein